MKSANSKTSTKSKSLSKSNTKRSSSNGKKEMPDQAFMKLFEDGMKDIYWVEKQLTKAIPKMIKKASSEELRGALEEHLEVTQEHVSRVEQVFELLGKKAQAKHCPAMEGILEEGEEHMSEHEGMVRDAVMISGAQKVEHYEIAAYGTLCAYANLLGKEDIAQILKQTLDEEKEADEKLTQIAESTVNAEALMMGEEDMEMADAR